MGYVRIQAIFMLSMSFALAFGQSGSEAGKKTIPTEIPLYSISFQQGAPVSGIGAVPAMRLPFECAGDGTVFITIVQPLGVGSPPRNLAQFSPSMLVTSIALSGEAHSFPLDQVPELYDVTDIDHYATESKVIFLLRAASGAGQAPAVPGTPANDAEHHLYIAIFNRDGTYQKTLQVADDFRIYQLGLFPSGNYLAYGYDKNDHSPKLAMLKDDGTILKYLQAPKGGVPDSPLGTLDGKGKGATVYLAPVQFAGSDHSIYVVQSKTDYPLLEVTEAGEIREIHPKLPKGSQINMLIPSDESLYGLVGEKDNRSIYEIDAVSGDLLKHFQVSKDQPGASVACVNGGKFLSFEDIKGKLVPLIGTAEPGVSASN